MRTRCAGCSNAGSRKILVLSILLGITIGLMDWLLQLILVEGVARLAR
jgi:hypothetical protein